VFFEVLILNGGNRAVQNFGALFVGHQDAALQREAARKLAVIRVNFGHHVGAIGFQRANFRQVAGVNKQQTAACTQRDRTKQQKNQRDAVNQFPAAQSQRNGWQAQHESIILPH